MTLLQLLDALLNFLSVRRILVELEILAIRRQRHPPDRLSSRRPRPRADKASLIQVAAAPPPETGRSPHRNRPSSDKTCPPQCSCCACSGSQTGAGGTAGSADSEALLESVGLSPVLEAVRRADLRQEAVAGHPLNPMPAPPPELEWPGTPTAAPIRPEQKRESHHQTV